MPNRLAQESSPYLLQHQENPVDWFPWSQEALSLAVQQDKPIFLSIGYSACHWCHVMERESFENEQIAGMLNENFVNIKVDREERPDLDQIYMNAVMALRNGQGGWPLSVFLTPKQKVFFGGTYWPPTSRVGMPGFDHVLHSVLDAFTNRRDQVDQQSEQITTWLNETDRKTNDSSLDQSLLIAAAETLHRNFDFEHGGFGSAPKFPHAMDLSLLVRLSKHGLANAPLGQATLLEMVRTTLKKMAYGGIFDHLAGGFARYSVDEFWLVPHFEKMLYDNALLVGAYLDMYAVTDNEFYGMIARKTCNYLLNYMTEEAGGFHSTEDADSEGVEGKFYVWSKSEIVAVLGPDVGTLFCQLYNVTETGNFEGANILNMTVSYQQFADEHNIEKAQLRDVMRRARQRLLEIRDQRVRPGKDDKILVSWNALAVSALSKASILLNEPAYHVAAKRAADFIWMQMRREDGRLQHTWRRGSAKIDAFLDDYSFLINAMLDLYEVDLDMTRIDQAYTLAETMFNHFRCETGGFFFTADDQEKLIARQSSFQDGSTPSGNSIAALALMRLGRLTGQTWLVETADSTIRAASAVLKQSPMACGQMLIALHEAVNDYQLFVVVAESQEALSYVQQTFLRERPVGIQIIGMVSGNPSLSVLAPLLADKRQIGDQTTLYLCNRDCCASPMTGIDNIVNAISSAST